MKRAAPLAVLCFGLGFAFGCGSSPGVCLPESCSDPAAECVETDEGPRCRCPEGTMDMGEGCVAPQRCGDTTCSGRGECSEEADGVSCACEEGYGGPLCERCADGLHDDGVGGCSDDPCLPNPCSSERVCRVDEGVGVCACPAGMHDVMGSCVDDTMCLPTSCNMRGVCEDDEGVVLCTCEPGWVGDACDGCDVEGGYHADGEGGCTTDACVPNPCEDPWRNVCVADEHGGTQCQCDPGYHLEFDECVEDEVCGSESCSSRGACAIIEGRVSCECDEGWSGIACASCDAAGGYHADGEGGCTTDVCAPNPCTIVPNRGVCSETDAGFSCSCDHGFHDDGVGGCTTDPCVPNPCAMSGQACRDQGGVAECYTPDCDDGNPCTTDELSSTGVCVFTERADGSACSTTLCIGGQQCTAGVCGGGTAVTCDDGNPCTADSCDAVTGCVNVADDLLVPDDGYTCTVGSCSGGVASHSPDDGVCEDGLWCTGEDVCAPSHPEADDRGCVGLDVPSAPGPDGPCGQWVCNDVAMRFDLVAESAGTPCDDGIACTSGDQCDGAGGCGGAVTPACGADGACAATIPWSSVVDVAPARVIGSLLFGGSETFPDATSSTGISIYLRARDTGIQHFLEGVSFLGGSTGPYPVHTFNERNDRVIDLPVMPGVYDVVYRRFGSLQSDTFITSHNPDDNYAHGIRYLAEGVVIGPGTNTLDVDVAPARVSGRLLYGGSETFPDATSSNGISIYLRAQDTGIQHFLEGVSFLSGSTGPYPVHTFNERNDRIIDLPVMPGVYDVVYRRFGSLQSDTFITSHNPDDNYAHGIRYLAEGVVIGPGTNTLDVDVAPARVSGRVLYGGSETFPDATSSTGISIYLRAQDTGIQQILEGVSFLSGGSGPYPVHTFNERNDRIIDLPVMPGVYDVVYRRFGSLQSNTFIPSHNPDDNYAHGIRYLAEGVVIGPGTNTLDVDVAPARVSGQVLYGGSETFPDATSSTGISIYLRAQDTGIQHFLEGVSFLSGSTGPYPVHTFNERNDRIIDLPVMPGVYDVVYRRFGSLQSDTFITSHNPDDNYAHGIRYLAEGVVIGPGTNTLDVDVAPARVSGQVLYGGSETFPDATSSTGINIYLRARDTGIQQILEGVSFLSGGPGPYPVHTFNERNDRIIDLPVMPGVYDVVYRRFGSLQSNTFITSHDPHDNYAHGIRYLAEGVVIGPGTNMLDVDVAPTRVSGQVLYGGSETFPDATSSTGIIIYLRARDTGIQHQLEGVSFLGGSTGPYPVHTFNERNDRIIDLPLMSGVYDVIYRRFGSLQSDTFITSHDPADNYAHGIRALQSCVLIP